MSHLTSATLAPLVDALADAVARPRDLRDQPVVLCPSPWWSRWLEQQLADRLGVVAGLRWLSPAAWLAAHLSPGGLDPFARGPLVWRVRAALAVGGPGLDPLHRAFAEATPDAQQALCEAWAARLAHDDRERPAVVRAVAARQAFEMIDDCGAALLRTVCDAGAVPRAVRLGRWRPSAAEVPLAVWSIGLAPLYAEALARCPTPPLMLTWAPTPLATPEAPLTGLERSSDAPEPAPGVRVIRAAGPRQLMERLRAEVLELLAADRHLHPGDVRLYAPDPDRWGPWFEAVFADRARGEPALPVRVGDRAPLTANPVASALLALLDLVGGRCTASALMALLARPPVLARFGLAADDLPALEGWITAAGVRFGVDAADRAAAGSAPDDRNTWRFGLDRLLLGCALPDEDGRLFEGVLPFDDVEGRVTARVGRLADFAETVFAARAAFAVPTDGPGWRARLRAAAEALLHRPAVDAEAWQAALDPVDALAGAAGVGALPWAAVAVRLRAAFAAREPGRGALGGAVELAALRAGAVVPSPVRVLVGLQAGDFPRSPPSLPGTDAAIQRADRARFLAGEAQALAEALAGAGTVLVGLVSQDAAGQPQAPSPLLGSALGQGADFVGILAASGQPGAAPKEGPPQPEAQPREGPPHDRAQDRAAALAVTAPFVAHLLPPTGERTVRLDQLARFFADPLVGFLRRLGVHAADAALRLEDEPPLMLDGLGLWQVGDALFERRLRGQPLAVAEAALRAAGRLPPGNAGEAVLIEAAGHAHQVALLVEETRPAEAPLPPVEVDLQLDGLRLVGRVEGAWRAGLLRAQSGKLRAKHLLKAWIEHLALLAMGGTGQALLIGRANTREGRPMRVRLGQPAQPPAELLAALVDLWRAGLRAPLPLLPESALIFTEVSLAARSLGPRDRDRVAQRWGWEAERVPGVQRLVGHGCPLLPETFVPAGALALPAAQIPEAARALWGPLVAARVGR